MRWTLISFLCIIAISNAAGQKNIGKYIIEGQSPINIGLDEVNKRFTPTSAKFQKLKSGSRKTSNINITYVGFPDEAKVAFEYAISIWEQFLTSPVPICVLAKWQKFNDNTLAQSHPKVFYKNFNSAPESDVYYPIALAEKLSGREWNGDKEADIICSFSNNTPWYFGTDGNTPETKYDFITVVLHEIAHGLGISGFLSVDNKIGEINNPGNTPSAYDYYIYNSNKQRISNCDIFDSPSAELHKQLTSNNLNFECNDFDRLDSKPAIYTPSNWRSGVSIYHLNNAQSNTNEDNELMSPYLCKGEANHNPGINTLQILHEIGWNSNFFQFQEIKDIEKTTTELPIQIKIDSDFPFENSSVQIIFSTDNFATRDSATFSFNRSNQLLEGKLFINNFKGKVKYFIQAETTENEIITYPKQAPNNFLSFKIGPDYYTPQLKHNPSKLVSSSNPKIDFSAFASDNVGINEVKIEYRINGVAQETFLLQANNSDQYTGELQLPAQLTKDDKIEYRIIAEDSSARNNRKLLPVQGYYQIEVFEALEPASGYYSDFNSKSNDFTTCDFEVNILSDFSNGFLHTKTPYPISNIEGEKYNSIAQLNQPIILEENGQMTFDEIVLVEPGEAGTVFTDDFFWDYVIVEASKNSGESWHPLLDGYDSGINESWESRFTNALKSGGSSSSATESMFWSQSINLTENTFFSAGDTVIFRFRLSSDKSISGWGWAIDNLKIQSLSIANKETLNNTNINMYPNPCTNNLFIDCKKISDLYSIEINIIDLFGVTVYCETRYNIKYEPKLKVDLSNVSAGIYLASITDSNSNSYTQKIIKQ